MDNEPEVIRRDMAETRAALADKLETLENKVVGTLEGANAAVHETVETVASSVQETVATVKGTVADAVDTVKETLDLRLQVRRHPCLMTGAAVAVGYMAGSLLGSRTSGRWQPGYLHQPLESPWPDGHRPQAMLEDLQSSRGVSHSTKHKAAGLFAPEVAQLKGLAVGFLVGAVRDAVSEALPDSMRPKFQETLDSVTQKLGGEVINGPVLEFKNGRSTTGHASSV
jgi:hypothetical protein